MLQKFASSDFSIPIFSCNLIKISFKLNNMSFKLSIQSFRLNVAIGDKIFIIN